MRRLAVRTLAAHRARLVMTLAAVCLGAAFVAGTLFFTASVEVTGALRNALLGFAGLALLVGSFVIANTFSMLVGQRTRELALLRAIGLSRRQLRRLVLGEALVVGLAGGVAGTAFGGGFAVVAVRVQDTPASFAFSWLAVLAGLAVGVGVTVLSAYASARRAARIAPVAAMRSEITSLRADLRRRTIAGLVVAAPGVALYAYAALTDVISEQVGLVGIAGTGLLILAVALLAPALCRLVLRPLSAPVARFSAIGRLAAGNAQRDPRRTAATASALMISLSVIAGLAIFGQSIKDSVTAAVRRDLAAQLVVEPSDRRVASIPPAEVEQLVAVPGVRAVAALRHAYPAVRIGQLPTQAPLTAVDPAAIPAALRLPMLAGRSDGLATGMLVSNDLARSYGLSVGDRVTVSWPKGGEHEFPVTGIYQGSTIVSGMLVPAPVALPHLTEPDAYVAFVALEPGVDEAAARAGLVQAVADHPQVVVHSRPEYLDKRIGDVDAPLSMLYALLALAVVIGILGVVNTMALSVLERTREIGLLRVLGLTRRQLRAAVRIESVLVAVFGGLFGIGGGYILGAMFQRAALRTGLLDATVPAGQLLLTLVALAAVGVAAAAWPARRATRINVLAAIATE